MAKESQLQEFIEALYTQYRGRLFRLVRTYISTPAAQEDVFHDVFVCIIQKAELLSKLPKPKLEAYLCLIARGVSVDYLRKNHCTEVVDLEDSVILDLINKQQLRDGDIPDAGQAT